MFLFPWFDYGIDIMKFEKSHFLAARVILGHFCPLKMRFFALRTMSKSCVNLPRVDIFQKFFEKFLEMFLSYPGIYFGPSGTIWALRKTILRKKSVKMSLEQGNPPPWSPTCVIYHQYGHYRLIYKKNVFFGLKHASFWLDFQGI